MTHTILYDGALWHNLLPFTFTRPVAEIRVGILKISEKWEQWLNVSTSYLTERYLQNKFPLNTDTENLIINAGLLPDAGVIQAIKTLPLNTGLFKADTFVAVKISDDQVEGFDPERIQSKENYDGSLSLLEHPWQIFKKNPEELEKDFELLNQGKKSAKLNETNTILGEHPVFVEDGAEVECSILNAQKGPIYIGKEAEVMEGSIIRGPAAFLEHAQVKMGAKIYEGTTFGPYCKAGGEVTNSVLMGYSNKAHDGFLGNSVIGEWCNIGADTNNSNLKNNYKEVKVWNYSDNRFRSTGEKFCGLFMADHSKCGINTMFNTGTVVGVSANIYGGGFPRVFVPSFAWGGASGFQTYQLNKAIETADKMMERRGLSCDETEQAILTEVFNRTEQYRSF